MLNLDNTIIGLLLVGALGGNAGNPKKPPEKPKVEQSKSQEKQEKKISSPVAKNKDTVVKGD